MYLVTGAVSLLPVFLFLGFLLFLDSFKLVKPSAVVTAIIWGMASAGLSYAASLFFIDYAHLNFLSYARYVAPVLEEILKALIIVLFLYRQRTAFVIDSAILGFAAGAGFATVENIYYLTALQTNDLLIWIIRGFGTALMHGGCTLIVAVIAIHMMNTGKAFSARILLPGFLVAVIIHGAFNQLLLDPLLFTLLITLVFPPLIWFVFRWDERSLRDWLEIELDTEMEMLLMIRQGKFSETRAGRYILSIKDSFEMEALVDILNYIRLYLELSIKAKGMLMIQESGFLTGRDEELTAKLRELQELEKSIGRTGLIVLSPIFRMDKKQIWKLNLLKQTKN